MKQITVATAEDIQALTAELEELRRQFEELRRKVEKPLRLNEWIKQYEPPYSRQRLTGLARDDKFPAYKVGKLWFVRPWEATEWLNGRMKYQRDNEL